MHAVVPANSETDRPRSKPIPEVSHAGSEHGSLRAGPACTTGTQSWLALVSGDSRIAPTCAQSLRV